MSNFKKLMMGAPSGGGGGSYIATTFDGGTNFALLDHTTAGSVTFAASYTLPDRGFGVT